MHRCSAIPALRITRFTYFHAVAQTKNQTILKWFQGQIERHRTKAYVAVGVIVTVSLILAEVFPGIAAYIYNPTLMGYLTLLVVLDIATDLGSRKDTLIRLMPNQDDSFAELLPVVSGCEKVELLEYAGSTTLPLIRAIARARIPVRLLVKHPDTVGKLQSQRTITALDTIYNSIYVEYDGKFEVRCYRQPYSLRGRCLVGRLLEIGWLTPDPNHQTVFGHQNPSLLIELPSSRHDHLVKLFHRTFDTYWNLPDTEDGLVVLQKSQAVAP